MEDKISESLDDQLLEQRLNDALGQLTCEQRDKDITLLTSDVVPFVVTAIKRSITIKPNNNHEFYSCPSCDHFVFTPRNERVCAYCGQRLDWFGIDE